MFKCLYKSILYIVLGIIFLLFEGKEIFFNGIFLVFAGEAVPPIKFGFQSPTYLLEKDIVKDTYICDNAQPDCKVNLDLRDTFGGSVPSAYACSIDFGFITGEEAKCNPNTVTFPEGDYAVKFTIYEKLHPENIQTSQILIKKIKPKIETPDIAFEIQSGLDLTSSGSYECKTASCSVNLTVESLFTGSYLASNYQCLWDFGSGVIENTSSITSCNPSYVFYPNYGNYSLAVIIQEKGNPRNFKTGNLSFINNKATQPIFNNGETNSGSTLTGTTTGTESGTLNIGTGTELSQTGTIDSGSGAGTSQTGLIDTGTGGQNPQTENISTGQTFKEIPELIVTFQSPSYLTETSAGNYDCDNSQPECKLNVSLLETFGGYIPTDFACRIDSELFSGQEINCNPNTIIVPEGNFPVTFTIYERLHPENFQSKSIQIHHTIPVVEVPTPIIEIQSGLKLSSSGTYLCSGQNGMVNLTGETSFSGVTSSLYSCVWDFGSGASFQASETTTCNPSYISFSSGEHTVSLRIFEIKKPENYKETFLSFSNPYIETQTESIPPIQIEFQSPSYVNYESWDGENLTCDPRQPLCKLNINLEKTFGNFIPTEYGCKTDFGFITGEEEKCNPNTVTFPSGKSKVTFTIFEKTHPENQQERVIYISNETILFLNSGGGAINTPSVNSGKEIIVQSGGQKEGENVLCQSKECKINLKYTPTSGEICLWNFGEVAVSEEQKSTCNPSSISFPQGESQVSLAIISAKTNQILSTFSLTVKNNFTTLGNNLPVAKIGVQGKLSKRRYFEGETFICYTKDTCSVNLTAQETYDIDKDTLDYTWWFGNGEVSSKENPTTILYPLGKYQIRLLVSDGKDKVRKYFSLEVRDEKQQGLNLEELKGESNFVGKIRIRSVLPNPQGKDTGEFIELQNLSFSSLNLKGLSLQSGKKAFTFKEESFLKPYESKRFFVGETDITLPNSSGSIALFDDKTLLDSLTWNTKIPENFILTHEILERQKIKGKVTEIIDGTSFFFQTDDGKKQRVHLLGIKGGENLSETDGVQNTSLGKEYLKDLIFGQEIFVEKSYEIPGEKYYGYAFLGNEMVNKKLLEAGIAYLSLQYPFIYSKEFSAIQSQAKKQEVGFWGQEQVRKSFLQEMRQEQRTSQFVSENYADILWRAENPRNLFLRISLPYQIWGNPKEISSILPQSEKGKGDVKKVKTNFAKIPFRINFTLLKSGLKIYGSTLSGSIVSIMGYTSPIDIQVGSNGEFLYKIDHNLVAGNYTLHYNVLKGMKDYEISREKYLQLTQNYVTEVQTKWVKSIQKKNHKSTKKKSSRKPKKTPPTKITQKVFPIPEISQSGKSFLWIWYFIGVLGILGLYFILSSKQLFDKK